MKTTVLVFALQRVIAGSTLVITTAAVAQPVKPTAAGTVQTSALPGAAPRLTSADPWEILPAMSADRCLAEAVGTASDPKTGAPMRASVDPQSGKRICAPAQTTMKPPR